MASTIAITSSSERPSLAVSRANCGVSATVWRRPSISLCVPMAYVSQWRIQLLWAQPGNRALADVVAVYDRAVALPIHVASAQRLLLLVRGQLGLAVELHTLRLGSHTAGAGAHRGCAAARTWLRSRSSLRPPPVQAKAQFAILFGDRFTRAM